MKDLRQVAQRALKAMEDGEDRADMVEFSDALIALREALAEPEQEQQNPRVVWAAAKPFRGILPWGQNPPDNDGTWFSFRGVDSFMWLDGAWFQMPPAPVVPWPGRQATPQPEQPVGINGLTEAETNASASVAGLVGKLGQQMWCACGDSIKPDSAWQDTDCYESNICQRSGYSLSTPRKPLTDEEMRECAQAMNAEPLAEGWPELIKFARAIENKHGIGEQHDEH